MNRGYGVVEKVTTKVFKGKTYHGFVLAGDEALYRTGQISPGVEVGAKVSFNYDTTDYGPMVDVKSIKAYKGKAEPLASSGSGNKDDYWRNKEHADVARQKQISYQAATNTAVNMVNFAIDKGYIKIGAKNSLEAYVAAVEHLAGGIYGNYQTIPFNENKPAEPDKEVVEEEVEEEGPF